MKVAVVIDTWFPYLGGGQINAWEISKRIANQGVYIDIITRDNGISRAEDSRNIKVFKLGPQALPFDTVSKLTYLLRAFFYLYSHDYDLIHAHAFLPGIVARLVMVTKGTPAILTVHGTSLGTNLLGPLQRFIEKFILTQIQYSVQITVSQDFFKFKNLNKNVLYIPNGIEIKTFDKVKPKKSKYPTLIFVGRLHPQKNLFRLIHAFKIVLATYPNTKLQIVGDGPQKLKLMQEAKKLKLTRSISFLGEVTGAGLIKLYKRAHIFILPSIYEGQPLTLLEAWASKLPVVTTKTGDCQFLVKKGVNGYLIENPQDASQIAKIIKRALAARHLQKLGANGYNLIAKKFPWEKSARETRKVYESLTKN